MKTSAKKVGGNQSYIVNGMLDNIDYETLEYSFDNGATWYTEDEIKEAIEAKSKSCENCKHSRSTNLRGEVSHGELFCTELVRFFHVGFCCNKHEPK